MKKDARPPFHEITESWGTRADRQQFALARQRYSTAAALGDRKVLVEIGCGTGYGLARVAQYAKSAIGIDIDRQNLEAAKARIPSALLVQGDGMSIPLKTASVDVLVGLEMFYYLSDQPRFVAEANRVIRPGGSLLLTMPNPDRAAFQASPMSSSYPTAPQLVDMLVRGGFEVDLFGACPLSDAPGVKEVLRRILVRFRLVPRTIEGRAQLKRLVSRRMKTLDMVEVDPSEGFDDLALLRDSQQATGYAIMVAVARQTSTAGS